MATHPHVAHCLHTYMPPSIYMNAQTSLPVTISCVRIYDQDDREFCTLSRQAPHRIEVCILHNTWQHIKAQQFRCGTAFNTSHILCIRTHPCSARMRRHYSGSPGYSAFCRYDRNVHTVPIISVITEAPQKVDGNTQRTLPRDNPLQHTTYTCSGYPFINIRALGK